MKKLFSCLGILLLMLLFSAQTRTYNHDQSSVLTGQFDTSSLTPAVVMSVPVGAPGVYSLKAMVYGHRDTTCGDIFLFSGFGGANLMTFSKLTIGGQVTGTPVSMYNVGSASGTMGAGSYDFLVTWEGVGSIASAGKVTFSFACGNTGGGPVSSIYPNSYLLVVRHS